MKTAHHQAVNIVNEIPNTYWIKKYRLLAGEYPGTPDIYQTREKIDKYLAAGINAFLDLTEDGELISYRSQLSQLSVQKGINCIYRRMAIQDLSTPKSPKYMLEILDQIDQWSNEGRNVYVHCWGGVGRTGTVVGCHLIRNGFDGDGAITQLSEYWKQMSLDKQKRHPQTPETVDQFNYIRSFHSLMDSNEVADK